MLKMRLQRTGRRNNATFRIIVTDSRRGPKSGHHVDLLGSYNPKMNQVQIDAQKAAAWIEKGVQPSVTMHNILVSQKIIDAKKINPLPKKQPIIDEEALKRQAEAAEQEAASAGDAESETDEKPTETTEAEK